MFVVLHSVVQNCVVKNVWMMNSCVRNDKRELERGVEARAALSPVHSWTITTWSGCKCRIVGFKKLQKWSDTNPPIWRNRCGGRWFLKLIEPLTCISSGVSWPLKGVYLLLFPRTELSISIMKQSQQVIACARSLKAKLDWTQNKSNS